MTTSTGPFRFVAGELITAARMNEFVDYVNAISRRVEAQADRTEQAADRTEAAIETVRRGIRLDGKIA